MAVGGDSHFVCRIVIWIWSMTRCIAMFIVRGYAMEWKWSSSRSIAVQTPFTIQTGNILTLYSPLNCVSAVHYLSLLLCCCLLIHNVPPCHHFVNGGYAANLLVPNSVLLAITRWLTIECTTNLNLVDDASVAPKNVVRLNFVSRFVLKKKIIFDTLWMPRCVLLLVLCCFRLLWFWKFWHFVLLRVALLGWEMATFPTMRFSHFSVFTPFWRTVSLDRIWRPDDLLVCFLYGNCCIAHHFYNFYGVDCLTLCSFHNSLCVWCLIISVFDFARSLARVTWRVGIGVWEGLCCIFHFVWISFIDIMVKFKWIPIVVMYSRDVQILNLIPWFFSFCQSIINIESLQSWFKKYRFK